MSQEKHFTAGRLAGWSVGIALLQFIVFAVTIKATGRIEDAVFAAMLVAFAVAFAAVFAGFAAVFAVFAAMFAMLAVLTVSAAFVTGFGAFVTFAAALTTIAAYDARDDGARGSFASLFYIALPLGIAGAIIAFAKTGSWGVALGILLTDVALKMTIAHLAERKPAPTAA